MTAEFEFFSVPRIVFGRGKSTRLAGICSGYGKSVLVVSNVNAPGSGGLTDRVLDAIAKAGPRCAAVFQRGEPEVADVDRALDTARSGGADVLVGLGGGSAIDLAKAVAGLLTNEGTCLDYMEVVGKGMKLARPAAPWIAVPTTAGTGAEVTRNAVIACRQKRFKASIRSEHLLARVAVVDPELGVGVPPDVTACAGMDALCQLIESYTSKNASPMTDALALAGIRLAARALPQAYRDGQDIRARSDMALAAMWSGLTLANAGLGAVHGLAAPLGASFPAPHGAVCAALLAPVMAANVKALREASPGHPTLTRYAEIGRTLTGKADVHYRATADPSAIDAGIDFAATLARELGIPRLGRFGITERDIPALVQAGRRSSSMKHNPVELSEEALAAVLQSAL
jgi:alcohol dehydrogenase class IV